MIVDRRKDNYDELQILAGDTRNRRHRANLWTSGLVVSGMIVSSAFVGTANRQIDDLQAGRDSAAAAQATAEAELDELRPMIVRLVRERDALKAEKDIYKDIAHSISEAASALNLGDSVMHITEALDSGSTPVANAAYPDIVWLVEGSRRFPMAQNDFLWIPEGSRWIRLDDLSEGRITLFIDRNDATNPDAGESFFLPTFVMVEGRDPDDRVCLSLDGPPSKRPGFQTNDFADMVVLFQSGECDFYPANRGTGQPE